MPIRRVFVGLFAGLLVLAAPACKTAAPIHPRAMEHNRFCVEYLAQGDLERAEVRCKLALEFNPDYPDVLLNRVREDGIFDHLGKTKAETKLDDMAHVAAVTLTFSPEDNDPATPTRRKVL